MTDCHGFPYRFIQQCGGNNCYPNEKFIWKIKNIYLRYL
jgi:hypothetical protein